MGVYLRGGTWWLSLSVNGQSVRRSTGVKELHPDAKRCDCRRLAGEIESKVRTRLVEEKWLGRPAGDTITVQQLLDRYVKEHSNPHKSEASARRDRELSGVICQTLGGDTLDRLTPQRLGELKVALRERGWAPRTINYAFAVLSHACTLAMKEWGWIRDNPVRLVRKEPVYNLKERWLTWEEEANLILAAIPWLRPIIRLATATGLRESELINLTWEQIDLNRRVLYIWQQKNKERSGLPLNNTALEVLLEQKQTDSPYVFHTQNGTPYSRHNLLRAFYAACKRAGITDLRFHDLRHTFATRLVQSGVDLYTVQQLGRWKTITMVQRYAHHSPESLRPGVEQLDKRGE